MFAIISAHLPELSPLESKLRHAALVADLQDEGFVTTDVEGCYNGEVEPSILVTMRADATVFRYWAIEPLREKYGQESVLVVHNDGRAFLDFGQDKAFTRIGDWKPLPKGRPYPNAYTVIGEVPFVCEK